MSPTANRVAVATTSQLAADAAAEIAALGGTAVDCGIAAAMCSINTQPGVCALAGSAYVTIWKEGDRPVTIDGNVAVPGLGLADDKTAEPEPVTLEYGGGITTLVGASSVAVPGTLAALYLAAARYGTLPWRELLGPSIRAARHGFPLARACHYYLGIAGRAIYDRSDDGFAALHDGDGKLLPEGGTIVVPHLADSLAMIAEDGAAAFYSGDLGRALVAHVRDRGGRLTLMDLATYTPAVRDSLTIDANGWQIATNPPPAIGGANLAAMLLSFGVEPFADWDDASLGRLIETQRAVMAYRRDLLDAAHDVSEPVRRLLELATDGELVPRYASASTVHTSAVDAAGTGCAITASSGYGSGEMPAGTGLWLNNCLGEIELNPFGLEAQPPGRRLPSNMAPTCARSGQAILALGSPGADRITTALHQFLVNFMQRGLDLASAVTHPRVHLTLDAAGGIVAAEPDMCIPDTGIPLHRYPELDMYFGGVVAAMADRDGSFDAAADPRREGGTYVGPRH